MIKLNFNVKFNDKKIYLTFKKKGLLYTVGSEDGGLFGLHWLRFKKLNTIANSTIVSDKL